MKANLKSTTRYSSSTTQGMVVNHRIALAVHGILIKVEYQHVVNVIKRTVFPIVSSQSLAKVRVVSIVTIRDSIINK